MLVTMNEEGDRVERLFADVIHLRSFRDDRSAAYEHRHNFERRINANHRAARILFTRVQIVPDTFRQIDHAARLVRLQHGRDQQVIADHELIVEVERVGIVLIIEHERTKERHACAMRLFQHSVEIRQQAIAQLEIFANNIFVVFAEAPGFLIVAVNLFVVATEGR